MKRPRHIHCLRCNYDLRASRTSLRCPECALPLAASRTRARLWILRFPSRYLGYLVVALFALTLPMLAVNRLYGVPDPRLYQTAWYAPLLACATWSALYPGSAIYRISGLLAFGSAVIGAFATFRGPELSVGRGVAEVTFILSFAWAIVWLRKAFAEIPARAVSRAWTAWALSLIVGAYAGSAVLGEDFVISWWIVGIVIGMWYCLLLASLCALYQAGRIGVVPP